MEELVAASGRKADAQGVVFGEFRGEKEELQKEKARLVGFSHSFITLTVY